MVIIYDLSKSDFDKYVNSNNELANNEITKLFKNVPELEYNIIMRILKRANSTTNYCSQTYADFMSSISSLDNDGYVKLFKELLNAYEISTKDVLGMNEFRLVIFNKLRDAQNVYKEKFKDGKIKIEDAHNEGAEDTFGDEGDSDVEDTKSNVITTKSKTKKSVSKKASEATEADETKVTKTTKTTKTTKVAAEETTVKAVEETTVKASEETKVKASKGKKKEVDPVTKDAEPVTKEDDTEAGAKEKGKRVKKGKQ
jgi:hypothetical protein